MARIVQKFGGTSVADLERIRNVAARVKREVDAGDQVAVVVSAMAGDDQPAGRLGARARRRRHDAREYDVGGRHRRAGDRRAAGARAADDRRAGALLAGLADAGSRPTRVHGKARIEEIDAAESGRAWPQGQVAVVAGFQGLGPDGRVTTLGRGGSDTSAVALAAALGADRCDIFTDVDGVYTTDPRIVAKARKLDRITYEEMLEMASLGRQGAADPLGRAGDEAPRARAGAVELRGRARNAGRG